MELGSGGGNTAFHLKRLVEMTLVDRAPAMLDVSRALNPECEHVEGDMRSVRLGRLFDAVFVHDAIAYMTTTEDLRCAFATAYAHLRSGGTALFAPDMISETFRPGTDCGGRDAGERGLRYLEWTRRSGADRHTYIVDFACLLREGEEVRVTRDRHVCGLFARADWLSLLRQVGFEPYLLPFPQGTSATGTAEVFLGKRV